MALTAQYSATQCPDRDALLAFDSGELPAAEIETIGSHLKTCDSCLAFLDNQNKGDSNPSTINDSPSPAADGESAKSSLLDDTSFERMRGNPAVQRIKDRAKRIQIYESVLTAPWPPDEKSAPAQTPAGEVLPEKIARYFVIKKLGNGAFANVYLARDPEQDRLVAIKVPRADRLKSPAQIEEFLREARTAATLDHPHIVREFDFGRLSGGSCYVVMKYVEGTTLEAAMKSERFSFQRIAELCIQIAAALDHAHQKKIFHRDVKPANILLDKEGQAYVADFGLAIHEETQYLHKDERAGTWPYMSPEQIRGKSHHLDARSDVWSLGVILYELLTREKPFPSKNKQLLEEEIQFREPKPPRSYDREIPEQLERFCLNCLAKNVSTRCPSAAEVAESLRAWLQSRRRTRQIRVWGTATLLGVVMIGLLVWATAFGWFGSGTTPADKKDESLPPVVTAAPENPSKKISLLKTNPVVVFGHPRPDPFFDAAQHVYSVGPATNYWIAKVHHRPSEPVHLQATVSLKDWVGAIGFAWQFQGLNQLPGQSNRWFVAEFDRSASGLPCTLIVQELTLSPGGFAGPSGGLADQEIELPKKTSAEMDLVIEDNVLSFSLGDKNIRVVVPQEGTTVRTWLEQGELTVALFGKGESATIKNATLEPVAPAK